MPDLQITEPPAEVTAEIRRLRVALDDVIPARQIDRNLLVGTWNLRAFGGLTKKWRSSPDDSPKRDFRDVRAIAEVVSRFDVVALQEVRGDLRALRHMLKALGPDWGVIMTDVTKGRAGNNERMAFVFDTRRVKPSGLAAELVVAIEDQVEEVTPSTLTRQFARTPYAVSFAAGKHTFILVTLHILWGDVPDARIPELRAIGEWLADWAEREEEWNHNLITLGDFNINRRGDPLFDAFTASGLVTPEGLNGVPRTIFDVPTDSSFYDQIAWFTDANQGPLLTFQCIGAGTFDFVPLLRGELAKTALSWRISDHYPLWVEFALPRP